MNGLFGIQDPRQRFGVQPAQRETIGPRPAREMEGKKKKGILGGYQSPSQGLFSQYMQGIFNQRYAPPMMQGSPLQKFGGTPGFYGFGSPVMPQVQSPAPPVQQANNDPNLQGPQPGSPELPWWVYNLA